MKTKLFLSQFENLKILSDIEHQQSDWYGIHEKICQSLIPIRSKLPFLPSEEERKKRDDDLKNKKFQLIEFTRSIAQRYLFEGDYQRAIPGAMTSLKLVIEMFGIKSVELVPSYLILGESSQGATRICSTAFSNIHCLLYLFSFRLKVSEILHKLRNTCLKLNGRY